MQFFFVLFLHTEIEQVGPQQGGWVDEVLEAAVHSPDGHVSVLGLAWQGTALQWCLGDSRHGLVHQHLLVLHFLTCATHKIYHTV